MAPRLCVCGKEIPMIEEMGPVASIASLKFYENAALYGRPSSRQKCFFCDVCTKELILFLKDRQANGPGAEEMVG